MSSANRLVEAFQLQFSWIRVLLVDPSRYSHAERKRCVVFAVMHLCFVLMVFLHFLSHFASWVLAFVMQGAALCLALIHMGFVEEYVTKKGNALDTERLVNVVIVAEVAVRCFATLHCLLMRSTVLFLFCFAELLYDFVVAQRRSLLLDATTIWKEIRTFQTDSRIRIAYQAFLTVASIVHLMSCLSAV